MENFRQLYVLSVSEENPPDGGTVWFVAPSLPFLFVCTPVRQLL